MLLILPAPRKDQNEFSLAAGSGERSKVDDGR